MTHQASQPTRYWGWAARPYAASLIVLGVLLARLAYLARWCPYTLVEDEAHYWEWSRRLSLSYYTKGPGVAWTIAAFTRVFGEGEAAIRAGGPIASAICGLAIAGLAADIFRDRRVGVVALLCFLLAPMFQVSGLMMTIDGPYAACWAVAAWSAWRAIGRGRAAAWAGFGAAMGVGLLYKYTILLLLPGVLGFWLVHRRDANVARRHAGPIAAGLLLLLLGFAPIVIWNLRNGWPTIAHLLGHLGLAGGDMPVTQGKGGWEYRPKWTLDFLGTQVGMIGPAIVLMGAAWARAWRARRTPDESSLGRSFLVWCAAPILIFYFMVSFVAEPEGNWALGGYLTLSPLAGGLVVGAMDRRVGEGLVRFLWHATLVVGVVVALVLPRLDLLARLPLIGARIPAGRFTSADAMGRDAARLGDELRRETGLEPFFLAMHYGRASQLAYYIPGRPIVYCSSSLMRDGRRTAYDYWSDTDLRRQPGLIGRPAIVVGAAKEDWEKVFDRVVEVGKLEGDHKRGRPAFKAYGFRGFPPGGI